MKKIFLVILVIFIYGSFSYAGQLGQNENGFYYVKDNGQLAISEWVNFDIDGDGMQEYYYLNAAGLLDVNTTTPDGYQVNEKGQWVENGIVKIVETIPGSNISYNQLKDLIELNMLYLPPHRLIGELDYFLVVRITNNSPFGFRLWDGVSVKDSSSVCFMENGKGTDANLLVNPGETKIIRFREANILQKDGDFLAHTLRCCASIRLNNIKITDVEFYVDNNVITSMFPYKLKI